MKRIQGSFYKPIGRRQEQKKFDRRISSVDISRQTPPSSNPPAKEGP